MNFCPSLNFGESREIDEKAEEKDAENSGKRMRFPIFGLGIGNFFRARNKDFKRSGSGHTIDLHAVIGENRKMTQSTPNTKKEMLC